MKTYEITKEVLENLAEELYEELVDYKGDNDRYSFEIGYEEYFITGECDLSFRYEDASFSHEFGIQQVDDWKLESINITDVEFLGWVDEDGEDHELPSTNEDIVYFENYINKKIERYVY